MLLFAPVGFLMFGEIPSKQQSAAYMLGIAAIVLMNF